MGTGHTMDRNGTRYEMAQAGMGQAGDEAKVGCGEDEMRWDGRLLDQLAVGGRDEPVEIGRYGEGADGIWTGTDGIWTAVDVCDWGCMRTCATWDACNLTSSAFSALPSRRHSQKPIAFASHPRVGRAPGLRPAQMLLALATTVQAAQPHSAHGS